MVGVVLPSALIRSWQDARVHYHLFLWTENWRKEVYPQEWSNSSPILPEGAEFRGEGI